MRIACRTVMGVLQPAYPVFHSRPPGVSTTRITTPRANVKTVQCTCPQPGRGNATHLVSPLRYPSDDGLELQVVFFDMVERNQKGLCLLYSKQFIAIYNNSY